MEEIILVIIIIIVIIIIGFLYYEYQQKIADESAANAVTLKLQQIQLDLQNKADQAQIIANLQAQQAAAIQAQKEQLVAQQAAALKAQQAQLVAQQAAAVKAQ